jgi:hypothetical protein
MNTKILALSALSMLSAFASTQASATNLFDPTVSATTIADGSSVRLDGTLNDTNGNSQPWTAELYAAPGECVRFFVNSTNFDSELTVIAPNGTVYRNDDGGGSLRPLVKIASAPSQGWYTVQVAHFAGAAINSNFTLLYGRYSAGNVNCAGATLPALSAVSNAAPDTFKDESVIGPVAPRRANAP